MSAIRELWKLAMCGFIESDTYAAAKAVDIDRTEKLISLGEAALAREIASAEYDYAADRLGKETVHAKAVIYDAADDAYHTALAALKGP